MDEFARLLFDESADGLLLLDASARVQAVNSAAARLCGRERASLVGSPIADLLRAETAEAAADLNHAARTGERLPDSATYTTPAGQAVAVRVVRADAAQTLVTLRDPTAGKPDSSHEAEARYRRLFKNNLAGVWRATSEGRLLECNDAYARVFGYDTVDEIRALPLAGLYYNPADRDVKIARLLREGRLMDHECRLRRRDGSEVWVLENIHAVDGPDGTRVLEGTQFDITERKRAEAEFAREHALMRAVFESTPDMLFYKGRDGRYRGCNRTFEVYCGVREKDLIGRTTAELFPALAAALDREDRQTYESRAPVRVERWIRHGDARRLVETVLTPLLDEGGKVLGLLGVGRDITARRKSEEQLRQSSKMEAIGQLAGGVAHDFNNLLTIILGNLIVARGTLPDPHDARDALEDCEKAARRAAELTGQLLGFARRAPMSMVPTDLNACVGATISLLKRVLDPRVLVDVRADPALWSVDAASTQIEQVLMNLCLNARDAMPDGGRITFSTENVAVRASYAGRLLDARPGEFIRLRVEDTGVGIPPETVGRVFEPFFTTKPVGKGTGLGLAMVFGIVKQHNGWIECHSRPGDGTRFDIYLPRSTGTRPEPARLPAAPGPGTETVLLVDDEPMIRNLGKATLERHGYRVLLAGDGTEAIAVYRKQADQIAVVVMDLTMPLMTGQEAARELWKLDPDVKVLFASGYSADAFGTEPTAAWVVGFLQKPYHPDELAAAVRAAVDQAE